MGTFYADFMVANLANRTQTAVLKALVDTGSEATWIAEGILHKIGVVPEKKDITFVLADGREVSREIGYAVIRLGESVTVDEVVFAREGDMQILGARTLEGLNLTVHPRNKTLAPAGPRLAAAELPVLARL